jgi:hypothetical protein
MIELMYREPSNERLHGVKKKDIKVGKSIETIFGEEFVSKREKEISSIDGEIKVDTLMEIKLGNKTGIVRTQYNLLNEENGEWTADYVLTHAYFPGDKNYSELKQMMETNRK